MNETSVPTAPLASDAWKEASILAVMALFFLQPLLMGVMFVRLPDIQLTLGVNKAELAIGLIGGSFGGLAMLPFAGTFAARTGVRSTMLIGFPLYTFAITTVGLATSLPQFFVAFFFTGMSIAFTELGLNTHANIVEQRRGRLIMNKAHGCWSLGLMAGSLLGVTLAQFGLGYLASAALVGLVYLPFAFWLILGLPRSEKHGEKKAFKIRLPKLRLPSLPSATLAGICLFILGMAMTEGALIDWGAIYLRELTGSNDPSTGYSVSVFAAFVTTGRFVGDWLKGRLGQVLLARLLCGLAIAGLVLVVWPLNIAMAFIGLGLLGFGVSVGFPLAMSAAGLLEGETAKHVAFVTFFAILAFLLGPPIIGFIAEASNMRYGLAAMLPMLLLSLACTGALRSKAKKDG